MRTRFTFSTNVEQTIKQSRRNNKMYLFNKSGTANKKTNKQTNKQASKKQTNNKMYLFNKSGTAWAGKSGGTKMEFGGGAWKFKFWNLKGVWKLNFEVHGGVKFSWTDFPPGGIQLNLIFPQVAACHWHWQVAFNWKTHRPTAKVCHRRAKVLLVNLKRFKMIIILPIFFGTDFQLANLPD